MSPPSTRELAQTAYAAYGASTGHKNYQGLPMPAWGDLTAPIQLAWIEAAGAIALDVLAGLTGVQHSLEPDVGDVVLVPMAPTVNNGARFAPAIVTRVWSPTTINVRVLADSENPAPDWRTSVVYADSLSDAYNSASVWTWPGGEN